MTVMRTPIRLLLSLLLTALVAATAAPSAVAAEAEDEATEYGRMLLVLDSSGSMAEPTGGGQTKIQAARQALARVVDDLPETADVGLRVFGSEVFSRDQPGACTDSTLVVPPGTGNRDALRAAVADYRPFGETPIAHALEQAAADLGGEGARSIVLVSDGIATCQPDPCEVAADLAQAGIELRIDVVGLSVDRRTRDQLACVARAGNGEYYDADSAEDIVAQLETVATRAVRPFEVDGTPLEGGTELDPTPVTAGRWTDEVGDQDAEAEAERWFRFERTLPGSTVHVGAVSLGSASNDSLQVDVMSDDGGFCWSGSASKQLVSSQLVSAGVTVDALTDSVDEACDDGPLRLAVSRGALRAEGAAAYGLEIVEEPPVSDVDALPESLERSPQISVEPVSGSPRPVLGGSSFATATEVAPGAYEGTAVAGETQVFRVPVSWGQSLTARVVTPEASDAVEEASTRVLGPFASLAVHNPLRRTTATLGGTTTGFGTNSELSTGTGEVRYRNREQKNAFNLAGEHYIEYAVDDDEDLAGLELPFRLEVAVTGEESGVPAYVGADAPLTTAPGTAADEATPAPQADDAPAAEEAGTPLRLLAAGGLGLVAVAAVAVGVLLLRRSRPQQ